MFGYEGAVSTCSFARAQRNCQSSGWLCKNFRRLWSKMGVLESCLVSLLTYLLCKVKITNIITHTQKTCKFTRYKRNKNTQDNDFTKKIQPIVSISGSLPKKYPPRELTYPTYGKGKIIFPATFQGDMTGIC